MKDFERSKYLLQRDPFLAIALQKVLASKAAICIYFRTDMGKQVFGKQDHEVGKDESGLSGSLSFGEAKLPAFPVRSAHGCFAWLTSPLALRRWQRDAAHSGRGKR